MKVKLTMKAVAAALLAAGSFAAQAVQVPTSLDSIAGSLTWKLQGLSTEVNTWAGTNESTWGIGHITQLIGNGTNNEVWNESTTDGTYLYYIIYGISDLNIRDDGAGGFKIYNVGATGGSGDGLIHIDLYRSSTVLQSVIDGTANPTGANRSAYNMYSAFSALGPAYLTATFGAGKQTTNLADLALCNGINGSAPGNGTPCETAHVDERLSTLVQSTNSAVLPASGTGTFFLDVTGGAAMTKWDTNGLFGHDFDANFTLIPNSTTYGGSCTDAQVAANVCFSGNINDPIRSNAIPEPGGVALVGLSLTCLAALRRRGARRS